MLSKRETGIKIEPQVSANRPSKNWAQYYTFVSSLLLEILFPHGRHDYFSEWPRNPMQERMRILSSHSEFRCEKLRDVL